MAAENGHIATVQLLLASKANVNAVTKVSHKCESVWVWVRVRVRVWVLGCVCVRACVRACLLFFVRA